MEVIEHTSAEDMLEFAMAWYYLTGLVMSKEGVARYWERRATYRQAG